MANAAPRDDRGTTRLVGCGGHSFGPDLECPCGTTWFEHQNAPRRCTQKAQRCKRQVSGTAPTPSTSDPERD